MRTSDVEGRRGHPGRDRPRGRLRRVERDRDVPGRRCRRGVCEHRQHRQARKFYRAPDAHATAPISHPQHSPSPRCRCKPRRPRIRDGRLLNGQSQQQDRRRRVVQPGGSILATMLLRNARERRPARLLASALNRERAASTRVLVLNSSSGLDIRVGEIAASRGIANSTARVGVADARDERQRCRGARGEPVHLPCEAVTRTSEESSSALRPDERFPRRRSPPDDRPGRALGRERDRQPVLAHDRLVGRIASSRV